MCGKPCGLVGEKVGNHGYSIEYSPPWENMSPNDMADEKMLLVKTQMAATQY
jgi:hypothetical protein